jgi:hypothetical protein
MIKLSIFLIVLMVACNINSNSSGFITNSNENSNLVRHTQEYLECNFSKKSDNDFIQFSADKEYLSKIPDSCAMLFLDELQFRTIKSNFDTKFYQLLDTICSSSDGWLSDYISNKLVQLFLNDSDDFLNYLNNGHVSKQFKELFQYGLCYFVFNNSNPQTAKEEISKRLELKQNSNKSFIPEMFGILYKPNDFECD